MAAITLLLLWLFQFLYFNVIYYNRQISHVKNVRDDLISNYNFDNYDNWQIFSTTANAQNLEIYIFTFNKKNIIELNNNGYAFPSKTEVFIATPSYSTHANMESLLWTDERKTQFLSYIVNDNEEFYYIEETDNDSFTDIMICASTLKVKPMGNEKFYICLVSNISSSNYTVSIMQNLLLTASAFILAVSIIFSIIFSKRLSTPINHLSVTAIKLAKGDFNVDFKNSSIREVNELATSLNFAKEEMQKTEQMRRDFIANVSHDLRTPLTMIKAYAEMIRDLSGKNEEKRNKHCQIIIDESNRLSSLVGDIQNLSKLQSGVDSYIFDSFDLSELCKTIVNRFGIISETQGFIFNLDCEDSAFCYGDYQKIEQVLYNLIGNAINYTGDDKTVTIKCKKVEEGYKVEIIDSGNGIDPKEIDFVWDRYYRANQKKRNIIGSGLGLNIVHIILTSHQTPFGVESELDKGTTFWFILPFAK